MPMLTTNQCNYQAKLRLHNTLLHSTPLHFSPIPIQSDLLHSALVDLTRFKVGQKERETAKKKKTKKKKTDGTLNMHPVCAKVATPTGSEGSLGDTLPPTPTRRSRCYQQLLCTRLADWLTGWLAAPSQMKTKQKEQLQQQLRLLQLKQQQQLRQLLFTTRQPQPRLQVGPWRMLAHIKRKLLKINHGTVSRSDDDEDGEGDAETWSWMLHVLHVLHVAATSATAAVPSAVRRFCMPQHWPLAATGECCRLLLASC